ncbi:MAG: prepilin-type N-terminal cleavage/methylation domain-containing protein [bacterium]|nr:prepilin-type N-terminal cleavage/methylation domain-containing protein [bacterium]
MKKKFAAFTLIELMVVIAIIALLAVVGITSYATALKKARDSKKMSDIENIAQALVLYRSDNGSYPVTSTVKTSLINGKYLTDANAVGLSDGSYTYTSGTSTPKTFSLCTTQKLENIKSANSYDYKKLDKCTGGTSSGTKTCEFWCVTNP